MKITTENAVKLIKKTKGRIFSVTFEKKDGTIRNMNCRIGVKNHLKGGELNYDPKEFELFPVFDVQANDYRVINIPNLKRIAVDGEEYEVV